MSLPEIIVASNRQKVARIAQDILDGRVGVIEASRAVVALRFEVAVDEWDPDFITFVGIDSETDDLPVGKAQQHWAPDALAQKAAEIARFQDLYREPAREAAAHLVARFAQEKPPANAYDYFTPNT
jgi:hypothetical protein